MLWEFFFFNRKTIAIWRSGLQLATKAGCSIKGNQAVRQWNKNSLPAWALQLLLPFNEGTQFKVWKDPNALKWIFTCNDSNRRLLKWRLRVSELEVERICCPGPDHQVPDVLSKTIQTVGLWSVQTNRCWVPTCSSAALEHCLKEEKCLVPHVFNDSFQNVNVMTRSHISSHTSVEDKLNNVLMKKIW